MWGLQAGYVWKNRDFSLEAWTAIGEDCDVSFWGCVICTKQVELESTL